MYWLANPEYSVENNANDQLIGDSNTQSVPAPRMSKVIAARQAMIFQDFDEEQMLDQIVNTVTSDAMSE